MDHELLKIVWWLLIGVMLIGFVLGESLDVGARVLVPWLSGKVPNRCSRLRPRLSLSTCCGCWPWDARLRWSGHRSVAWPA
ncbi:hypothetical protein ACSQ5K_16895 [Pseudomonas sp. PhalM4]